MATDNKRKLYDALSQDYDMGTYEQFCDDLNDENKRRKLYDVTSKDYDFGSWDSFSQQLGYGQTPSSTTVSEPVTPEQPKQPEYFKLRRGGKDFTVSTDEVNAAGGLAEWAKANPGAPLRVYMQGNKDDGKSFYGHVDLSVAHDRKQKGLKYSIARKPIEETQTPSQAPSQEPWEPTAQENAAMSRKLRNAQAQADAMFDESHKRMEDLSEYYNNPSRFGFKSVESKPVINSEAGKLEKTYITPFGERVKGKESADKAEHQYRQAMIAADMTVGAQIRRAEYELQELQRQLNDSASRVHDEWKKDYEENDAPLASVLAANTYVPRQQADKENSALRVAIRQKEEQLKDLYEERDRQMGKDVGFWRGFGRIAGDIRTWDFGIGDLSNNITMLNADQYMSPDATDGEKRAGQEMLKAIYDNQEVERMYGDNASFWNRAGVMTGYMPSFMLDFALTGGGFEAINVAGKAAARGAVKLVGKEAIEEMAKLGVKEYAKKYGAKGVGRMVENWTIKALGTTADELLIRAPLMTNTVQAGKTVADIIDRKLGDVVVDENGNYDFSNDKTWGSAIWQGEANAIIENYSEMFGTHLDGVLTAFAKTFGGKRISGMLARANASNYGQILATTRKQFERLGVSDYFGEVGEEYYGQLWRTMLNLDDAYQQNPDGTRTNLLFTGKFHGDIWGGMALSMGLMGAAKYSISGIAYGSMKHQVNKADKRAAEVLTPDRWEPIRELIDNTANEDMGTLAESMIGDSKLSDDERAAVMEYMERSMNLRGNNLGAMAQSRGTTDGVSPDIMVDGELSQSYMDGYDASSSQELNDAQNMYEYQRQRAEGIFDKSYLEALEQNPVYYLQEMSQTGLFTQEEIDAARDYINAKTVRDGIIQRVNDNIDEQIAQSDAIINGRVNKVSGMIQPAVMGLDDRQVYVVGGSLVVNEDGTIDRDASDESIVIRDAVTGEIEFTDPKSIVSAGEAIDPEVERAAAVDNIRQQAAQAAADALNGTLPFNPGDAVQIDLGGGYVTATVVGPVIDEESGAPVEGQVIVQMADGQQTVFTKEQLQAFADAANYERLNTFEQGRAATRTQQRSAEASTPQFALNDEFTIHNDAGTPIRGSITRELDEDGTIEIYTEEPINGNRVNRVTPAELQGMLESYNGQPANIQEESTSGFGADNWVDKRPDDNYGFTPTESRQSDALIDAARNGDAEAIEKLNTYGIEIGTAGVYRFARQEEIDALLQGKHYSGRSGNGRVDVTASENVTSAASAEYRIKFKSDFDLYKTGNGRTRLKSSQEKDGWIMDGYDLADVESIEQLQPDGTYKEVWSAETPLNPTENAVSNAETAPNTPSSVENGQETPAPTAEPTPLQRLPHDAKGEPIFEQAENPEHGWDALVEYNEGDASDAQQMADIIAEQKRKAYEKAQKQKPSGNSPAQIKESQKKIKAALSQAEQEYNMWQQIANVEQRRQDAIRAQQEAERAEIERAELEAAEAEKKRKANIDKRLHDTFEEVKDVPEAVEVLEDMNPHDIYEAAAELLSWQKVIWSGEGGFKSETGYGEGERRKFLGLFASKDKGGMSLQRLAEEPMKQLCEIHGIAYDNQDARNALIDVIGGALTIGDIRNYIANNRINEARKIAKAKRRYDEEIYDDFCQKEYHMSAVDVEAYEENLMSNIEETYREFDEYEYNGYIADEMAREAAIQNPVENGKENTAARRTSTSGDRRVQENDTKGTGDISWRGNEVLPESRSDKPGRATADGDRPVVQPSDGIESNGTASAVAQGASRGAVESGVSRQEGEIPTQNKLFNYFAGPIRDLIELARGTATGLLKKIVAPISERLQQDLASYGIDVSADYKHVIDNNAIRHALKNHGGRQEEKRGQIPLTDADFERIEDVVTNYDSISIEKGKRNDVNIVYSKSYADGTTIFVEEKRDGRKELAAITMWKKKNSTHTDANHNVTPISDSSEVSDSKDIAFLSEKQGDGKKVYLETEELDKPELSERIDIADDDWTEGDNKYPTHKRTITIDGKHEVVQVDEPNAKGIYTGSYYEYQGRRFGDLSEVISHIDKQAKLAADIAAAESEVNTEPTPAQAEAGNYKKGHVTIGEFDITIENPAGSVRKGVDSDGKEWSNTMANTYGYIKGTEGVDGDHIDVFLHSDMDQWNGRKVFVVDQTNTDGSFDEHKVMFGFNDKDDAMSAYLANYDKTWADTHPGLRISETNIEDFNKWVQSSHRKTKPFADYTAVSKVVNEAPVKTEPQQPLQSAAKGIAGEKKSRQTKSEKAYETIEERDSYSIELRHTQDGDKYALRLKKGTKSSEWKQGLEDYGTWSADGRGEILFDSFEALTKFLESRGEEVSKISDKVKWMQRDREIDEQLYTDTGIGNGQTWIGADGTRVKIGARGFVKGPNGWDFATTVTYSDGRVESTMTPAARIADFFKDNGYSLEDRKITAPKQKRTKKKGDASIDSGADALPDKGAKIEDFGEKIAGARKDMLRNVARSVENVTLQSLIELPLSKAFKQPPLKKMVESGVISDEDAMLAEAVMQSMIYAQKKPVLTRRPSSRRELESWAKSTYDGVKLLGEILSGDESRKDEAMAHHKAQLAEKLADENAHIAKIREWNPGQNFDDLESYPDPIVIIKEVLERSGYRPGDKVELPLTRVKLTLAAQNYEVSASGKQGAYWFKRFHHSLEEAIETMILAARLAKGDMDVEIPQRQYSIRGIGNRHMEATGKYVVQYIGNKNAYDFHEEVFATEEKAKEFAEKKNGRVVAQQRYTNDYDNYAVVVVNPLTGNSHQVSESLDTRAQATEWLDEHAEEVNARALEAIYKENGTTGKPKEHFYVSLTFNKGVSIYSVVSDDKSNPWPIIKDFRSRKEATEWLEANKASLEAERKARKEKERAVVYYNTDKERKGLDYRHGKDATPEMFSEAFGFRGVQFGNWTNDADRQEGLNQTYDALMDMARFLAITPKAISLDGELALAFGARGNGSASAHYEPTEVVINLTKTRGAGTLAHEWWHAVDNFLSRKTGVPYGYASHLNGIENMNMDVRESIENMMSRLSGSEYVKRSSAKGDYWGRPTEIMARLFESWIEWRMAKDGQRSPFLAAGLNLNAMKMYQTLNYFVYKRHEILKAEREDRKPEILTQEQFNDTPESLSGYPYPTEAEVERFAPHIEAIFSALGTREQESGSFAGETLRRYGRRYNTVSGESLFDWADREERRKADDMRNEHDKMAEVANNSIDSYCDEFKAYIEKVNAIEKQLSETVGQNTDADILREQLDYEEQAILEARGRLEENLKNYYVQSNSPEDAVKIARDMVSRIQAEVTTRLNGSQILKDILVNERQPQLNDESTETRNGKMKTSGGFIAYDALGHLPNPNKGEFAYIERRFSMSGEFNFTGNERIHDRGDVAYLFRALENYAIEHVFAVLVKDGKFKVLHLGMGSPTMSAAYMGAIRAGYDAFGADEIYLVHNHPSGNLISSAQDRGLMRTIEQAFDGVKTEGIIMDTTSGRYHVFNSRGQVSTSDDFSMENNELSSKASGNAERPRSGGNEVANVLRLDHMETLETNAVPEKASTPALVEQFISRQRLGSAEKVSYIVLSNNLDIIGNFHTEYNSLDANSLAEEIASAATKFGGTRVIVYGNVPLNGVSELGDNVKRLSLNNITLTDAISIKNGIRQSAFDEGMLRDAEQAYHSELTGLESQLSDSSAGEADEEMLYRAAMSREREDFDSMRQRAIAERGIVMSGLNEATVKIVDVPRHDFPGTGKEALQAAEKWAKENIVGVHTATDSRGEEFEYTISNGAIDKYVSRSATSKSENLGVHLSALRKLPEIIAESLEVEVHPDYKKGEDGKRRVDGGVNQESLVHRFYGSAMIDGTPYRIKTTMRQYRDEKRMPLAYSYEITQIELMKAPSDGVASNSGEHLAMTPSSSISVAKILKGVEKSYDAGKKLLDESKITENPSSEQESQLTDVSAEEAEDDVLCRPVTDKATLDRLNSEPTIKVYRAMQMIDGGLRPPMSAKVDGQLRDATEVGVWEEAEEHPEMADENGRFKLDKGNGKSIKAAYNPYIHTSRSPINDQFSSAWSRPELVTVEVEIPESELTSGYRAEKAKDTVGEKEWKSGPVGRALAKIGQARRVILSRWSRVVRVVPVEEVADAYAQRLNAHGIEVPFNTVPPALRDALVERGVKIGKPEKGNAGSASLPAFEQWISEQERQRQGDGYGAYSDAEVSYLNDPISIVLGKNRFSKKRQAEFAARERQRMVDRIQELAKRMHLDNVEIVTDASQLDGKRATAKGFFNKRTGKITIVIPNNVSTLDAMQTLLHEGVAHYGLRQLFGSHFDTFLDNVYEAADESVRRKIAELAAKNGWDFRTATEEYLAGLAEEMNFEQAKYNVSWWAKIKSLFIDMLEHIGFEGFRDKTGIVLTDNELRYLMWRSYENLAEPGRYRSILGEAKDIAKQAELKVGNYAPTATDIAMAGEQARNEAIGEVFDEQLGQYERGELKPGHRFELGMPSKYLRSAGFPNLPISMRATLLASKASMNRHPFMASDLKGLVDAIQKPIAIFEYSKANMRNLIVDVKRGDKHFLVGVTLNYRAGDIEINSVSGLFPKDSIEWLKWIQDGKAIRIDQKEKVQAIIDSQRTTNTVESERIGLNLDNTANIVKDFKNPIIEVEDSVLFRSSGTARAEYDAHVRTKIIDKENLKRKGTNRAGQLNEAYLDSMRSLKILQEAVSHESGKPILDFENAYIYENQMSSRNKIAEETYKRDFFKPLCDAVAELCKGEKKSYKGLIDYTIAKHGLERNAHMRAKAVANGTDQATADSTDYSGLTALTGEKDIAAAEQLAEQMVADYESNHNTDELWKRINAATKETLHTRYQGGLLSKDVYEEIRDMYAFYIPLKGWEDTTATDVYEYAAGNYGLGSALMTAYGRTSVADDPFATIMIDAQRTIMEANRNIMKQTFLNLALNHQTDLLTVSKQWYVKQPDGTWMPHNPVIPEDADADTVDAIVKQHEADMLALQASGDAVTRRRGLRLGLISKDADTTQHVVKVKRNGETFCIYVNGDPRAARAINGMLNPDVGEKSRAAEAAQAVKDFMSKAFTTWNPEFVVGNLSRDVMFAGVAVAVKEDGKYTKRYTSNITSILVKASLPRLLYKWEHGTLDDSIEIERYFKEFLKNGGETGFTQLNTVEKAKRDMQRFLKEAQGGASSITRKAWRGFWNGVEFLNRSAEDTTRFAVYMTSRQQGRSISRSVYDAKEITVNFNKKGSGAWGARYLNFLYVFFNAAMQAVANAGRLVYRHPGKSSAAMGIFMSTGFFMPLISCILAGLCGDGDGDDDYWDLPEWVRRNNIVIYIPFTKKFLTIPIAHELRPFYGLGEIAYSVMCGKEEVEDGIWKAIEGFSGLLPIDYTGNGGDQVVNFSPTISQPVVQSYRNVDYFGKPIYKETPWNTDDPEWTKAYKGTNGLLVDLTKMLSEAASTTDEYGVVDYPEHWYTGDINPAIVEHLLESYTGGLGKTVNGLGKTISMLWDEDARELRNVPVFRKFIQSSDARAEERRFSNDYFKIRDEYEDSKKYLRKLGKLDDAGAMGVADRVNRWLDTDKGKRYLVMDDYFKGLNSYKREIDSEMSDSIRNLIQHDMDSVKHELVQKIDSINSGFNVQQ